MDSIPLTLPVRAASRGHTPPINLKERIAALQQRSVSPNLHQSAQAVPRGLPSPGSGGLRDKIAKFESRGGTPVPRGGLAMGVPQLAENAPQGRRIELYGNRVPGLGRPSGPPVSRSRSPTDESPSPRKRCISTGTGLSTPPSLSTTEPVPPMPNGLSGAAVPRRNSLAVHLGSGRRVMSASDADAKAADASPPFLAPETPPETARPVSPDVESATLSVQLPSPEAPRNTPEVSEPPQATSSAAPTSAEDPPPRDHPTLPYDASESFVVEQGSADGHSDYESAPQSAVSPPSPSLLTPAHVLTPAPPEGTPSGDTTITISVLNPPAPASPSIATPTPTAETSPQSKPTFKAVVHRKVTEPISPALPSLAPPVAPQLIRPRHGIHVNVVEPSPTPGFGDLAVLLEDAALLELRLTEGDGTDLKAGELVASTPTPTHATFRPDPRHESVSTLTERAPVPSSDSGSQSARSASIPSIREPLIDGEIPEGEETDGRSLASTTFSQRSPSHRKYLSNIYRLTGRRSSSYMPGAYPRDSMSMSSEDSSPVTTPSDNGKRKGFGIAWPSSSPKRGGINAGRSSSFTDKIFYRNRTKSNVSTADRVLERTSLYQSSQASLAISFPSELSQEGDAIAVDMARPTPWISSGDEGGEFSPASSPLDKDIFDAFPSVPQTLPPGFHLEVESAAMGRANTLPVKGRTQVVERLSMV